MDNDTVGVGERTLSQVRTWPPGLPIFGLLTPLPATPLYKRLEAAGRLTRVKHWQEFIPFAMAHTPLKMSIEEAHAEVKYGWAACLQSGGSGPCRGLIGRSAAGVSHQHLYCAAVLPRHLFSDDGALRMAKSDRGEPAHHFQAGKGSGVWAHGASEESAGGSCIRRGCAGDSGERRGLRVLPRPKARAINDFVGGLFYATELSTSCLAPVVPERMQSGTPMPR